MRRPAASARLLVMSTEGRISATARPLPEGTVTFVFTDIEGSTNILRRLGSRYGGMIAEHARLIRAALESHDGWEVDTQGDAFFCVFGRAGDAVSFAASLQQAIEAHEWPEGVALRIRIAIHTGEPALADKRYYGVDVHRTARLCATARGGEVLLSDLAASLVREQLPKDVGLIERGMVELKDFPGPAPVYQLRVPGVPERAAVTADVVFAEPFHGAHEVLGRRVAERQTGAGAPVEAAGGREILLVCESAAGVEKLLSFARRAACRQGARGMILTCVVDDQDDVLPATRMLAGFRDRLAESAVSARVAAFRAADAGAAIEKLALRQEVGLVVVSAAPLVDGDDGLPLAILRSASCDVAIHLARDSGRADGPILVPFAGTDHDWAALELATTLAAGANVPLVLTGSNAGGPGVEGDASRLLATASLIVQQIGGLIAEPLLIPRGADAVVEAAMEASHVITGVPADYAERGIGSTRREIARRIPTTMTLVRRGERSGVISTDRDVTRFSWTGTSSGT
jgi:class 3 adenylate cyclase